MTREVRGNLRCFVHLASSTVWRAITREEPPTVPPTAEEYTRAGLPWFEYFADGMQAVQGTPTLKALMSVAALGVEKGQKPLPENTPVDPGNVVVLRAGLRPEQVREGAF